MALIPIPQPLDAEWTLHEFASVLRVNVETLRRLARKGKLVGAYKVGRQWRIHGKTALMALTGMPVQEGKA